MSIWQDGQTLLHPTVRRNMDSCTLQLTTSLGRVKTTCNRYMATQLMQTSKIMHDWLPAMHMTVHMYRSTQCPLCIHPDETLDHLLHCPHPFLQCKWDLILEHLWKKGLKLQTPYPVVLAWCTLLQTYVDNNTSTLPFASPEINQASAAQIAIRLKCLPHGFLSSQWIEAMEAHGGTHSTHKLSALIFFPLTEVTDALWQVRNDKTKNVNDLAQEGVVDDQLQWYLLNNRSVLSCHGHKLLNWITVEGLEVIPLRMIWQQKAIDSKKNTLESRQQLLRHYFAFRDWLPHHSFALD